MANFNEEVNIWIDRYVNSKQQDVSGRLIALNTLEQIVLSQRDINKLTPLVKSKLYPIIGSMLKLDWGIPEVKRSKPVAARSPILAVQSGYSHAIIETPTVTVKVDVKGKTRVTKHVLPSGSKVLSDPKVDEIAVNKERPSVKEVGLAAEKVLEVKTSSRSREVGNPESLNVNDFIHRPVVVPEEGITSPANSDVGNEAVAAKVVCATLDKSSSVDLRLTTSNSGDNPESKSSDRSDFERSEKMYSTRTTFVINGKDWVKPYSLGISDITSMPTFQKRGLMILNHSNCGATYCHLHIPDTFDSSRMVGSMSDKIHMTQQLIDKGFIVMTNNPKLGLYVNADQRLCYMHKDWEQRIVRKNFPGKADIAAMGSNLLEAKRYAGLYPVITRDMYLSEWLENSIIVHILRGGPTFN